MSKEKVNPPLNEWLTEITNSYAHIRKPISKRELNFLKDAYYIIITQGRGFCHLDLSGISPGMFRQHIMNLKHLIFIKQKGRPTYYGLNGLFIENLTDYHTYSEVSQDFDTLVSKCKKQQAKFHDFRIQTRTDDKLFQKLKELGKPIHKGMISIKIEPNIEPNRTCRVNVYSTGRILFIVGCTDVPFAFTPSGLDDMIEFLTESKLWLMGYSNCDFLIPRISSWQVVYYHLNHDLQIHNGRFNYTIGQLQLYVHKNKVTKTESIRFESHETPSNQNIDELQQRTIEYQKEIDDETKTEQQKALDQEKRKISEWYDDDTKYPVEFKKASKL
ncbi:MAG: hypothetical protein HOF89_06430 [Candidatus Nitrosopelagicus sp.]|jgi:hypothetical protein|nr:hypothetical protein [Candidatus Nitrosopelagicus sp.]